MGLDRAGILCSAPHLRFSCIRELANNFCIACMMFDKAEVFSGGECDQPRLWNAERMRSLASGFVTES